jgi:hypothetical protein
MESTARITTHAVKIKVCDLSLAIAAQSEAIGEGPDTVLSSVKGVLSVVRVCRLGVLKGRIASGH